MKQSIFKHLVYKEINKLFSLLIKTRLNVKKKKNNMSIHFTLSSRSYLVRPRTCWQFFLLFRCHMQQQQRTHKETLRREKKNILVNVFDV